MYRCLQSHIGCIFIPYQKHFELKRTKAVPMGQQIVRQEVGIQRELSEYGGQEQQAVVSHYSCSSAVCTLIPLFVLIHLYSGLKSRSYIRQGIYTADDGQSDKNNCVIWFSPIFAWGNSCWFSTIAAGCAMFSAISTDNCDISGQFMNDLQCSLAKG